MSARTDTGGGALAVVRSAALIAAAAGAVGSLGLMLRAGGRTPRFLLVLFVFWILSPFVGLVWANVASKGWSVLTRWTLYGVTFLLAVGSPAIYGDVVDVRPAGSANAVLFVAVPPASWLLMAVAVPLAAWISRRRSSPGAGP